LTKNRKRKYNARVETLARHELHHGDGRRLLLYGDHDGSQLPPDGAAGAWPALHLRFDALNDRWIAISPARNTRPESHDPAADTAAESGAAAPATEAPSEPAADAPPPAPPPPACPLCIGGPELPFRYEAAVFENRFPTLLADPPPPPDLDGPTAPSRGRCEVVLYTATHTGSLATLTSRELARVIAIWTDRSRELWADPAHRYVLIFENRGEDVGATLSHPHGQIYALDHVPPFARPRVEALRTHRGSEGGCLSCGIVTSDLASPTRRIVDNPSFTVAVPFAPDWPFEVHVRARRHGVRRLTDLTVEERRDLAAALREVVARYDVLFPEPLSYLMVCSEAPADADGDPVADWHLSFEFMPPNRGPDRLKVRASVETAAGFFINDTVPEDSAATLAAVHTATAGAYASIPDVEVVAAATLATDGTG
jgi:UDPglucose--hexose-1-phosphate uridylyltransferase